MAKSKPTASKKPVFEFKNNSQQLAWSILEQHDVAFLIGVAGTAKTFLATAYAVTEVLEKRKRKIVITRPTVEAGEKLGHLPGTFEAKVSPFLRPIIDCMDFLVGVDTPQRQRLEMAVEIAPLAYLRGRTFTNSICILDEAQNATDVQMKLFLTRLGENTKMIVTGDYTQSDLYSTNIPLQRIVEAMKVVNSIGVMEFSEMDVVRHPLIRHILAAWPKC